LKKITATGTTSLLLLVSLLNAAPPSLKIPSEVKPSGQYITLLPEGDAVSVQYVGLSGVDSMPSVILKDPRMFALDTRGLPEGSYKFVAVGSSKEGEQVRVDFVVVIGDSPIPPIPPGPNPPIPPSPVTDLQKKLQEAYSKETDSNKAKYKDSLVEVYTIASKLPENPKLTTWNQLFNAIKEGMKQAGLADNSLRLVRTVVQEHLEDRFPNKDKTLTVDDKKLIADTFTTLANTLQRFK
jgi:hypothetical protein